jgi:hypothetical protein
MEWIKLLVQAIQTHSVVISEFLRQMMLTAITFKMLSWTTEEQNAAMQFLSALLALFVAKTTVGAPKVTARIDEAHAEGYRAGVENGGSSRRK